MKKLVITAALIGLSATAANASNVHIGVGIGAPIYATPAPVYYAPAPVYYEPAPYYYGPPAYYPSYYNGRDRHRNYDWRYWHDNDHRGNSHWRDRDDDDHRDDHRGRH